MLYQFYGPLQIYLEAKYLFELSFFVTEFEIYKIFSQLLFCIF